ncbi:GlxA family transcriptional regulator [Paraglaciecola sp. 2405UD69-4]|uniref:GlxA family transcriptional regulator n=1 Tax=Paraglaciecola sp. 2405UD69-4 TaxID=3391836 RepID=UPI0039C969C6
MDKNLSSHLCRRVFFILFDGFELLDLSGPSSVFNTASLLLKEPSYQIYTLSTLGGMVRSRTGIEVNSQSIDSVSINAFDTVLMVGGSGTGLDKMAKDLALKAWLATHLSQFERLGSICSGALALAAYGFLDSRTATTHWADVDKMLSDFPKVRVKPDALYCVDGKIWTSAGVTTGIDMALAMVGSDYDSKLVHEVARWLVVYAHRPGHQSQFSELLAAQSSDSFTDIILWLESNLHKQIKVADMAKQVSMSERTFYRKFTDEVGTSPSKFLEMRRLFRAKHLLETGVAVKAVHLKVGYQSELGLTNGFKAKYGVTPAMYKKLHCK